MQNTYDLAVSGTHNFIADDVLVHNTWWLIETAIQSLLNKKRVVFFSLEMSARRVEDRLLSRMSSAGDKSTDYVYPVFDCWENQTGECKRVERVNKTRLLTDDDTLPDFKESMKYRVCTTCRGTNAFKPATWYIQKTRGKVTMRNSIRKANAIRRMYGDYLRIRSFPMNSASTGDIRSELDALENNEGFIPDVCIVDYADLLRPEDTRLSDVRARLDNIWKMLKNLADTRHVLVVTASQGNRASIKKKDIGQVDIAEDIRKLAHLDLMLSLNQTDDEKERGTMRIGIVAHRDGDFNPKKQVMTLQQRSVGQTLLDSEFVPPKKKKGKSFDDEDE
jgi:replicative DNA helicase